MLCVVWWLRDRAHGLWKIERQHFCVLLRCAALRCAALRCAALCCAVLRCAPLCCAVLRCAALCCAVLRCVVLLWLHCTLSHHLIISCVWFLLASVL